VAKNGFRATEIIHGREAVFIKPPELFAARAKPREEEVEPLEEYAGPTADDLRREAEQFRAGWEKEKEAMISAAKTEADRIVKDAETAAFEQLRKKNEEAASIRLKAEGEAEAALAEARKRAEAVEAEAREKAAALEEESRKSGFAEGREEGWKDGRAEAERLIERLHTILSKAIEKRGDIITQSEAQIVHLVLQIAKKVVKVISENQKNIVVNNALQALRKLKNKSDVVIRVNLLDVNLMTDHAKDIVGLIENVKSVSVLEDATVDRGGCIIETDFGEIDARIAAQLREIEERILELVPIQERDR
jgi:flagellar assembly protein FliH